jgi:hypothetical protein
MPKVDLGDFEIGDDVFGSSKPWYRKANLIDTTPETHKDMPAMYATCMICYRFATDNKPEGEPPTYPMASHPSKYTYKKIPGVSDKALEIMPSKMVEDGLIKLEEDGDISDGTKTLDEVRRYLDELNQSPVANPSEQKAATLAMKESLTEIKGPRKETWPEEGLGFHRPGAPSHGTCPLCTKFWYGVQL